MSMNIKIMDSKHKDVILFDITDLKRFSLEQLDVLRQQVRWEIQERIKK